MSCDICVYADEHGSWPTTHKGTHCSDCHRSWSSFAQSHCADCHRHFGSDSAGDNHRFGDYRNGKTPVCRDPVAFDRWETPAGVIWGGRNPVESAERARKMQEARFTPPAQREKPTEPAQMAPEGL